MSDEISDEPLFWEWAIKKIREREKEREQPQIELDIIYPDTNKEPENKNPYDVNYDINNDIYQM